MNGWTTQVQLLTEAWRARVEPQQRGRWTVERFEVKEGGGLQGMKHELEGRPVRDGVYTRLMRGPMTVVMSDTQAEFRDHMKLFLQAYSRRSESALVHGLGLGLAVQGLLTIESMKRIDVVELDPDVVAMTGQLFADDPRVNIHVGDAFEHKFPAGSFWDVAWHDIWDTISGDNLEQMKRLHRRYGRRTGWQGSWARELCRR